MERVMEKLVELQNGIHRKLSNRRGQNTVEYLLMLTVIIGVVLLAGGLMKKMMPGLFAQIHIINDPNRAEHVVPAPPDHPVIDLVESIPHPDLRGSEESHHMLIRDRGYLVCHVNKHFKLQGPAVIPVLHERLPYLLSLLGRKVTTARESSPVPLEIIAVPLLVLETEGFQLNLRQGIEVFDVCVQFQSSTPSIRSRKDRQLSPISISP